MVTSRHCAKPILQGAKSVPKLFPEEGWIYRIHPVSPKSGQIASTNHTRTDQTCDRPREASLESEGEAVAEDGLEHAIAEKLGEMRALRQVQCHGWRSPAGGRSLISEGRTIEAPARPGQSALS